MNDSPPKLIYLSSPYSNPSNYIRHRNFLEVCQAAGRLFAEGICVLSPIAHCHPITTVTEHDGTYTHWKAYNRLLIDRCDELWVLLLPAWSYSIGVTAEIEYAKHKGMPVFFLNPHTLNRSARP